MRDQPALDATNKLRELITDDLLGDLPTTIPPYRLAAIALRLVAQTDWTQANDTTLLTQALQTIYEWLRPHTDQPRARAYTAYIADIANHYTTTCDYAPQWHALLEELDIELQQ